MKLHLFLILLCLFSKPVLSSDFDTQDKLRTLFTTPHIRMQLDQQREEGKFTDQINKSSINIVKKPLTVKMQGVVIREPAKTIVFVNDSNTLQSPDINNEITVNDNRVKKNTYKVPVRVNQKTVNLKPGQQWNESDKQIQDNYQIKPSKKKTGVADEIMQEADNLLDNIP